MKSIKYFVSLFLGVFILVYFLCASVVLTVVDGESSNHYAYSLNIPDHKYKDSDFVDSYKKLQIDNITIITRFDNKFSIPIKATSRVSDLYLTHNNDKLFPIKFKTLKSYNYNLDKSNSFIAFLLSLAITLLVVVIKLFIIYYDRNKESIKLLLRSIYNKTKHYYFDIAISFLILLISIYVSAVIQFLLGFSISSVPFVLSSILMIVYLVYRRIGFASIMIFIFIICLLYLFKNIYDLSWDGNWYHGYGIYNMVYNKLNPYIDYQPDLAGGFFFFCWAKAQEILSAGLSYPFLDVGVGKASTVIFMLVAFLLAIDLLDKIAEINIKYRFAIICLLVLNPVVIAQMFTNYVDAQVYLLSIIICMLVIKVHLSNKSFFLLNVILFFTLCYSLNLKLTMLLWIAILLSGLAIIFIINHIKIRKFTLLIVFSAYIYGVLIFGFTPYVYNYLINGSIAYPFNIMNIVDVPTYFLNHNRFLNVILSVFAPVRDGNSDALITLKDVFSDYQISAYLGVKTNPDMRICGWGIFFPINMLLSLSIFTYLIINIKKFRSSILYSYFVIVACLFIVAFSTNFGWWARFNPFLYLFPCFSLFVLIYLKNKLIQINKVISYIRQLLCLLLILGQALTLFNTVKYQFKSNKAFISHFKPHVVYEINTLNGSWVYVRQVLDNNNVKYTVNNNLDCLSAADGYLYYHTVCYKAINVK